MACGALALPSNPLVHPRKLVAFFDVYLMISVPIEMEPSDAKRAVDRTGITTTRLSIPAERAVVARLAAVSRSEFVAIPPGYMAIDHYL